MYNAKNMYLFMEDGIMKLRILQIISLTILALPTHAIRMRTAGILTGLSAATSTLGSAYVMQKCGVHLPEMSSEVYASLVGAYVVANTVPTGYWLYNRTPQGRLRLAAKDLKQVTSDPLTQPKSGEDLLAVMNRVYVNKDFPYIESLHALQAHDARIKKAKELLAKGRSDLKKDDFILIDKYENAVKETEQTHQTVLDMIQAVRNLPDYTKRLKYFNEQQAQTVQAEAQKEQASAQKVIAGASMVGAFAKVIEAINPFKKGS
jgi:hypothetical protein